MADTNGFPEYDPLQPHLRGQQQGAFFENELLRGSQLLYEQAYRELCEAVTGKKPSDTPPNEEEFARQVHEFLQRHRDGVHEAVCKNFKYCEKKKKFGVLAIPIPMIFSLTGLLAEAIISFGFASTFWIMIKGLLDDFCDC